MILLVQANKANYYRKLSDNLRCKTIEYKDFLIEKDKEWDKYRYKIYDLDDQIGFLSDQKAKFKKLWSDLQKQKITEPSLNTFDYEITTSYEGGLKTLNATAKDLNSAISSGGNIMNNELLVDKLKEMLICPLSGEWFTNPVVLPSGVTVEESTYDNLAKENRRDPFNPSLYLSDKIKNRLIINLIEVVKKQEHSTISEVLKDQL